MKNAGIMLSPDKFQGTGSATDVTRIPSEGNPALFLELGKRIPERLRDLNKGGYKNWRTMT